MKFKVLNLEGSLSGIKTLFHERIERGYLVSCNVFTDYDAVIIDPAVVPEVWKRARSLPDGTDVTNTWEDGGFGEEIFSLIIRRRRQEILKLLQSGGVVICYLRPWNKGLSIRRDYTDHAQTVRVDNYSWLPPNVHAWLFGAIEHGNGEQVRVKDRSHAFAAYLEQLRDRVQFEAYLREESSGDRIKVIAEDRVGHPIAFEYRFLQGKIVFLPLSRADNRRESSLMLQCIRASLGGPDEAEPPDWATAYPVPGEHRHMDRIADLTAQIKQLDEECQILSAEQEQVGHLRVLLYEQGKFRLEPIVRSALRCLGFQVPDPDEYEKDWDAVICSPEGNAIAEIEGTQDQVDVRKFRQLLHYISEEAEEGKSYKGILIGNGYRNQDPQTRGLQFTDHALNGCKHHRYCALPTSELFEALRAVSERPDDSGLKSRIRSSILEKVGLYNFDESVGSGQRSISKNGETV
ncbi:MAG: hypothetical protein Q8R28_16120 [Dehalococcoidia bacterium]|nr:hypothetical protein [Dehalococcoidia bacterium]